MDIKSPRARLIILADLLYLVAYLSLLKNFLVSLFYFAANISYIKLENESPVNFSTSFHEFTLFSSIYFFIL